MPRLDECERCSYRIKFTGKHTWIHATLNATRIGLCPTCAQYIATPQDGSADICPTCNTPLINCHDARPKLPQPRLPYILT
jgi:hypothetical protein